MTDKTSPHAPDALAALVGAVPPGLTSLTGRDLIDLRRATADLLRVGGRTAQSELARFRETCGRGLAVDDAALRDAHADRTVLVTGGTGCIGSSLIRELLQFGPRRIISVSRGQSRRWARSPGVDYVHVDLRDRQALLSLFGAVKPDIVYHLAAQHDPGLAEVEVDRTISTNVTGTVNIVDACRLLPGIRLACASTGKAVRPFSRDVYAASKKMTEWILRQAACSDGLKVSAVRFTHVVDNSIIFERLSEWSRVGPVIRLHSAETMFYLQSAREAAQLLLSSVLDSASGKLALSAIRDLGWPASLLDLALGAVATSPIQTPLYICGFEAGYEKEPYPALYDPEISGCRSPLFNSMEAPELIDSAACADVDVYRPAPVVGLHVSSLIRRAGARAAPGVAPGILRAHIEECGWSMLRESLDHLPTAVLTRQAELLGKRSAQQFSDDDARIRSMVDLELGHRSMVPDSIGSHRLRRSA